MAVGLIVYDILYLTVAVGLYGAAGWAAWQAGASLAAVMPLAFAVPLAGVVFLFALVALVWALTLPLPRLRAGAHPMMKGGVFWSWLLRSLLRRVLYFAPIKVLLFTSNVLRFLSLRALGAQVAFTANMSSDVDLLDPALTRVDAGATLGARCLVSAHYIKDGALVLEPVHVGANTLLAVEVVVGPGVRVGRDCLILGRVGLNRGVTVGDGAIIGGESTTEAGVAVPAGARVGFAEVLRRDRGGGVSTPQDV